MTSSPGYSGTPLAKKLGLRDGQSVLFIDLPPSLAGLAAAQAFAGVDRISAGDIATLRGPYDLVHLFTAARAVLKAAAPTLMRAIVPDGTIWVSWPKKASKAKTDITEDVIREIVLPIGLVDVKVCAVDGVWSGLKLVIRKELRHSQPSLVGLPT